MVNRPKDKWYSEMTDRELDDAYNLKLTECSIENNLSIEERELCDTHINEYMNEIQFRWESDKLDREIREVITEGVALKEELDNTKNKVKALNSFVKGQK